MTRPLDVFLIAGEASGEPLGAPLMRALSARPRGEVHFAGVGGRARASAGVDSLRPLGALASTRAAPIPSTTPHAPNLPPPNPPRFQSPPSSFPIV